MPSRTNTEKIDDLSKSVTTLETIVAAVESQQENQRQVLEGFQSQQTQVLERLAVVEHRLDEIEKANSRFGERLWAVLLAIVTALIGLAVGYVLPR